LVNSGLAPWLLIDTNLNSIVMFNSNIIMITLFKPKYFKYLEILFLVPSQVVLLKNVQKNNMSVCTKIAIQINCKLGGVPWRVVISEPVCLIVNYKFLFCKCINSNYFMSIFRV